MPKTAKKNHDSTKTGRKGPELEAHQVILKPLVTEKGVFQSTEFNQYTFQVNPLATKTDIKNAIESLFEVKVAKIATQTRKGKPRRYKFTHGTSKGFKKAIVKLAGDDKIDFF